MGFVSDKSILECVFLNLDDEKIGDLVELLKPSLEDAKIKGKIQEAEI